MAKIGISRPNPEGVCVCVDIVTHMNYQNLISVESIFQAWGEFRKGKGKRRDVQEFERYLEDNLFELHERLKSKTYKHGAYESFYIREPKRRHIHKAQVADRVLHHLLYRFLYGLFDKTFVYDSYSCRLEKGTHRAVTRLENFTRAVSKNYAKPCWVLKCDARKFFATIDHRILLEILERKISDKDIRWLLSEVIYSFNSEFGTGKGIPLGNLTSQVFANVYLNELDKFVKHGLKEKYYIRYCDDFIILSQDQCYLFQCIDSLEQFVGGRLQLGLHPKKVTIRKLRQGIDFLGYVVLPHHNLPRTKTKRRIFKNLKPQAKAPNFNASFQSYLGYLEHANAFSLTQQLKNEIWIWQNR